MEEKYPLTHKVIDCAIVVHRALGPGQLESAYQTCLTHKLTISNNPFVEEFSVPLKYRKIFLEMNFYIQRLIDGTHRFRV